VRQLAYLQTAPEPKRKPKNPAPSDQRPPSRMQRHQSQGTQPPLPEPGLARHLVDYLLQVGPTGYGAMGPVPLSHSEIAAWQANTGAELTAWEATTLRTLSIDWITSSQAAQAEDCPAPWVDVHQVERARVADAVRNIFGGRASQQRQAQGAH
jgi:hypothetical protein